MDALIDRLGPVPFATALPERVAGRGQVVILALPLSVGLDRDANGDDRPLVASTADEDPTWEDAEWR